MDTRFEDTPWGAAQTAEEVRPGIWRIETGSHGGYFLSKERNDGIPEALKAGTVDGQGRRGWYEEDGDAAVVEYTFFEEFDQRDAAQSKWIAYSISRVQHESGYCKVQSERSILKDLIRKRSKLHER